MNKFKLFSLVALGAVVLAVGATKAFAQTSDRSANLEAEYMNDKRPISATIYGFALTKDKQPIVNVKMTLERKVGSRTWQKFQTLTTGNTGYYYFNIKQKGVYRITPHFYNEPFNPEKYVVEVKKSGGVGQLNFTKVNLSARKSWHDHYT